MNNQTKKSAKGTKSIVNPIVEVKADKQQLIDKINALQISEKVSANRSIFKKEFNNKNDRTRCRTQFQNAISLFLLNVSKGKNEIADEYLIKAKAIASKYYVAEDKFANATDYYVNGRDARTVELISTFIDAVKG